MKPLPATPELLQVARRVVWFKAPEAALADPIHFLAHVMTYGTADDLAYTSYLELNLGGRTGYKLGFVASTG